MCIRDRQLDPHLDAVGRYLVAGGTLLLGLRLRQYAEQVLHMMTDLVRNHVSLGEFAGLAATSLETNTHVAEERSVEINALVGRTVKGTIGACAKPQPPCSE